MSVNRRLERAYGFGQGIYDLSPKPIVAQRAPTIRDFAEIGTIWVDQVGQVAYTLIEVAANQAVWGNQAQIGNLVANLTVNPGPLELLSNANNAQQFLVDLNGGAAETAEILVQQGTTAASILLDSTAGGVTINSGLAAAAGITLESQNTGGIFLHADGAAGQDIFLQNDNGSIGLDAAEAANNAISINASNAAGGVRIGAGTGGEVHTIANGVFTANTGTGTVNISTDNTATTVHLADGGGAKTVTLGSTNTTSTTTIQSGTGGIALSTGAIAANAGSISVAPLTSSTASPTATVVMDRRVGRALFTGFTTASAASQVFTITNATIIANSGIFVTAQNAGANDAQMTVTRVKPAVGSMEVTLRNDGAAALNGDVIITFWVIS